MLDCNNKIQKIVKQHTQGGTAKTKSNIHTNSTSIGEMDEVDSISFLDTNITAICSSQRLPKACYQKQLT
jgi:hypothetical protein